MPKLNSNLIPGPLDQFDGHLIVTCQYYMMTMHIASHYILILLVNGSAVIQHRLCTAEVLASILANYSRDEVKVIR